MDRPLADTGDTRDHAVLASIGGRGAGSGHTDLTGRPPRVVRDLQPGGRSAQRTRQMDNPLLWGPHLVTISSFLVRSTQGLLARLQ